MYTSPCCIKCPVWNTSQVSKIMKIICGFFFYGAKFFRPVFFPTNIGSLKISNILEKKMLHRIPVQVTKKKRWTHTCKHIIAWDTRINNKTLIGWILECFSSPNISVTIFTFAWSSNTPKFVIFPRFLIIAVIGMSFSKASQT